MRDFSPFSSTRLGTGLWNGAIDIGGIGKGSRKHGYDGLFVGMIRGLGIVDRFKHLVIGISPGASGSEQGVEEWDRIGRLWE